VPGLNYVKEQKVGTKLYLTHETEECATFGLVRLCALGSGIFKVKMFQEQQQGCEQDARHEQQERGQELLQSQRVARFMLLLPRFTGACHPVPS